MKRNLFKRGMAGLLSLVMCLTALVGLGTTTAFAAGEQAEVVPSPTRAVRHITRESSPAIPRLKRFRFIGVFPPCKK